MPDSNLPLDGPVAEETNPALPYRHPSEVITFATALVVVLVALGVDVSTNVLLAAFAVVGTLPAIVTWVVNLYRDARRQLGE